MNDHHIVILKCINKTNYYFQIKTHLIILSSENDMTRIKNGTQNRCVVSVLEILRGDNTCILRGWFDVSSTHQTVQLSSIHFCEIDRIFHFVIDHQLMSKEMILRLLEGHIHSLSEGIHGQLVDT